MEVFHTVGRSRSSNEIFVMKSAIEAGTGTDFFVDRPGNASGGLPDKNLLFSIL
jgi:hypothetical protein